MTVRYDGIGFDQVPVPAVMAPDGPGGAAAASMFGLDTVNIPAIALPQDHTGELPGEPYFLAGHVDDPADAGEARRTAGATAPDASEATQSAQQLPSQPSGADGPGADPRHTAIRAMGAASTAARAWRARSDGSRG